VSIRHNKKSNTMKVLKTITREYSKDVYLMEILEGSFGDKHYSLFVNGIFQKTYMRMPKDLREFFNI
jgi:hypothetical protein